MSDVPSRQGTKLNKAQTLTFFPVLGMQTQLSEWIDIAAVRIDASISYRIRSFGKR